MSSLKVEDLTIDDLETAVAIIKHFIARSERAKSLLRQLDLQVRGVQQPGYGGRGMNVLGINSFDDLVNLCVAIDQKKKGVSAQPAPEVPSGELPPEEVDKMKKLVEKVRGEKKAES